MKNLLGLASGYIVGIVFGLIFLGAVILFCVLVPVKEYFKCLFSKCHVGAVTLRAMKMRNLPCSLITEWYIYSRHTGLNISIKDLEGHYGSGGNLQNVVSGLVYAQNASVDLSFDSAKTLDLEGRDIKNIIEECINVRTFESGIFKTVSRDEKEILFNIQISVKTNLDKLIGGVKEDTLLARAKEIFICMVACDIAKDAIKNCDTYTKNIELKELDKDSFYKIVGVDVVEVKLGKDYAFERTLEDEEHQKKMSVIAIENEKAQKALEEQNLKNKVQQELYEKARVEKEMSMDVINKVNEGKITMVEYYKLQNLIADTEMRKSILDNLASDSKSAK